MAGVTWLARRERRVGELRRDQGSGETVNLVVFSKDRACQLHGFLTSFQRHVSGAGLPRVLFTASEDHFAWGYERLVELLPGVELTHEGDDFKRALLSLLDPSVSHTCFFVDDMVFRRGLQIGPSVTGWLEGGNVACLSLRLSPGIDYTYSTDVISPPPVSSAATWRWAGQPGDWGYPMSLDGHLFATSDVLPLVEGLEYTNPNSLEAALAASPIPKPLMACLADHVVVNIPANRVQDVFPNRHGAGWSAEHLNELFLAGSVIDTRELDGIPNRSAHHQVDYRLIPA